MAQPIEPLQADGQTGEEGVGDHRSGVVVGGVGEAVEVLSLVEEAVLDLPAALADPVQGQRADVACGEVGQPTGFDDVASAPVLPVADHPDRGPVQPGPGWQVVGIPDLDRLAWTSCTAVGGRPANRLPASSKRSGSISVRRATTGRRS